MLNVVQKHVFTFGLNTEYIHLGSPVDCKLERNPVAPDIWVICFT